MAAKQWWTKLVFDDLDRDCGSLSLAARGAWVWIFEYLKHHEGRQTLSLEGWARVIRASTNQTATVLAELFRTGTCDWGIVENAVTQKVTEKVTPESVTRDALIQKSDALYDVRCRRQIRLSNQNLKRNLRQQRYREKKARDATDDAGVTAIELEVNSYTPYSPPANGNGKAPGEEDYRALWEAYPAHRRKSLNLLFEALRPLHPTRELIGRMVEALALLRDSDQWRERNGQFVPSITNWISSRGWESIPTDRNDLPREPAGSDPAPPKGMAWKRGARGELIHPLMAELRDHEA